MSDELFTLPDGLRGVLARVDSVPDFPGARSLADDYPPRWDPPDNATLPEEFPFKLVPQKNSTVKVVAALFDGEVADPDMLSADKCIRNVSATPTYVWCQCAMQVFDGAGENGTWARDGASSVQAGGAMPAQSAGYCYVLIGIMEFMGASTLPKVMLQGLSGSQGFRRAGESDSFVQDNWRT